MKLTDEEINAAAMKGVDDWIAAGPDDPYNQQYYVRRAIAEAAYERVRHDALSQEGVKESIDNIIKRERHQILSYLNEAADTRDLDRRLQELKNEYDT